MERAICQYALDRVMLYLRNYGVAPAPQVCRRALALIDECLAEVVTGQGSSVPDPCHSDTPLPGGVLALVFDRLPGYFDLPELYVPLQRPPIQRGSIGYGPTL
ncbi:hypothetical protein SAMN04487962_10326 [Marinobacter segnicrescens]|uniref:Uncharacterized protein n=1 Tax=Marinobacter segnicrescens TaxID=430453 RepID=A0A1I0AM32_9GAMM|nr:hypothetical protein [Marinobacter segnicrescens]SES95365.1 hypothetical protein SAMN04487962_10326 [Marinobacter segnicrescens]